MDELVKLQNVNINNSISEGLEILFSHLITETKSKYGFYMMRNPPDKEWVIPELYFEDHSTKILNQSIVLHSELLNKYQLVKKLVFINEKLTNTDIKCFQIPGVLLHPNIQIVIVLINNQVVNDQAVNKHIPMFCVQFLKKYIDSIINENSSSIMRTLGKIKAPINEIIEYSEHNPKIDVKKSAISLAVIINDLVDLYKLKRNKMKLNREETKIRHVFVELNEIIDFKFVIDDEVPEVLFIDVKRLKQVLLNFINNDSFVYVDASMIIDMDDGNEILCWSLEFNIENPESVIDERLFISKKLISLMGGYFESFDYGNVVKFTIEACKDQNSYSDNSLKHIKGKKILIVDNQESRRLDLGHRLQKWELDISFASNEMEGSMFLDEKKNKIDLFIIGIPTFIDKLTKFNIHKPYLQILNIDIENSQKNEYLSVKDTTPVNSPRSRKSSVGKPAFLTYPIEDIKLLNIIIEVLN